MSAGAAKARPLDGIVPHPRPMPFFFGRSRPEDETVGLREHLQRAIPLPNLVDFHLV